MRVKTTCAWRAAAASRQDLLLSLERIAGVERERHHAAHNVLVVRRDDTRAVCRANRKDYYCIRAGSRRTCR